VNRREGAALVALDSPIGRGARAAARLIGESGRPRLLVVGVPAVLTGLVSGRPDVERALARTTMAKAIAVAIHGHELVLVHRERVHGFTRLPPAVENGAPPSPRVLARKCARRGALVVVFDADGRRQVVIKGATWPLQGRIELALNLIAALHATTVASARLDAAGDGPDAPELLALVDKLFRRAERCAIELSGAEGKLDVLVRRYPGHEHLAWAAERPWLARGSVVQLCQRLGIQWLGE
jgi:hypothetical protein